jgi:hypothetical protein
MASGNWRSTAALARLILRPGWAALAPGRCLASGGGVGFVRGERGCQEWKRRSAAGKHRTEARPLTWVKQHQVAARNEGGQVSQVVDGVEAHPKAPDGGRLPHLPVLTNSGDGCKVTGAVGWDWERMDGVA